MRIISLAITITDAQVRAISTAVEYGIGALAIALVAMVVWEYNRKVP